MSREITVAPAASLMMDASTQSKLAESLVMRGDISGLTAPQRVQYYLHTCAELGLNPNAQPFAFLKLNGKEVMYPTRGATDQLARIHQVNREIIDGPKVIDLAGTKLLYAVCRASLPSGRIETSTAAVPIPSGAEPVANAVMKVETKARRRATLAILGLALTDESEMDTIPAAARVDVPAPSREEIAQAMAAAKAPALPALASLGVEVQAPATTPAARREPLSETVRDRAEAIAGHNPSGGEWATAVAQAERDLVAEVRDSAAVRHTVRELADLWRSSREELKAAKLERPAWDVVVARCKALELIPKAVTAEIARLDAQDRGPGPKGGTPRPEAPAHVEASGTGQDVAPAAAAVALVPSWCSDVESMERHIEGYSHAVAVERCARKHRAALPRAARELLALRLQRLSWDPHDGEITLESARELVARWIAQGPVERVRPEARAKVTARRAVG